VEKESDLIQDGGKIKDKRTSITTVPSIFQSFAIFANPNISRWSLPLRISLINSVCECIYLSVVQQRRLIIKIIRGVGIGEGGWEGIFFCLTKETKLLDVISTTCCCIIELQ
jgi:hypothetical protein